MVSNVHFARQVALSGLQRFFPPLYFRTGIRTGIFFVPDADQDGFTMCCKRITIY